MNKELHKRLYDLASRDAEIFDIVFDEELTTVATLHDVFMDSVKFMKDFDHHDLKHLKEVSTVLLKYEDPYIWLERYGHIRPANDIKIKYILKDVARLLAKRLDNHLSDFTYRIEVDQSGNIVTGDIVQSPLEWLETEEENYKEVLNENHPSYDIDYSVHDKNNNIIYLVNMDDIDNINNYTVEELIDLSWKSIKGEK